jgi:hypothetical protein
MAQTPSNTDAGCAPNERGEMEFRNVGTLADIARACRWAKQRDIRKGRIVIEAARYVFLPFNKYRGRRWLRWLAGRNPDGLDPRVMTQHLSDMLSALMPGRRLPQNICSELLENHFESPLRSWCERLIVFRRIMRLEHAIQRALQELARAIRRQRGLWRFLGYSFLWPRWLLNKINLTTLRFQIDFSVILIAFFVRRRRNFVEVAWDIDGNDLRLEIANNAKIPRSLERIAANRVRLARGTAAQPRKLSAVEMDISQENRPLTHHKLSGSGLGMIMVASAALRYGGELTPPRYDRERRQTVAIFTAAVDHLPQSA